MPISKSERSTRELKPLLEQMIEQQHRTNELLAQLVDLNLQMEEMLGVDEVRARWDKIGAARAREWANESAPAAPTISDGLTIDDEVRIG